MPASRPFRRFQIILWLRCVAICLVLNSGAFAADDDDKGLLPPSSADHSPRVASIRRFLRAADLGAALHEIEDLKRSEPTNFEGYFWEGVAQLQGGRNYDAVRSLRHAEALDATEPVLKVLAFSYYKLRQFHLFVLKMNEALAKEPDDFSPYYALGRYYENDGNDCSKAEQYFRQALARKPAHFQSHDHLGYCLESQGNIDEAEEQYQTSAKLAEAQGARFAAPYAGLARLRIIANKPEEALALDERAVKLAPDDAEGHKVLAQIYSLLGRRSEEIDEWKQTAKIDPTDSSPYYHLFRIYSASGNKEQASAALTQFKKLLSLY